MNAHVRRLLVVLALVVASQTLHAGSAIWNLNPVSNDWNTAENWTPATIPSSETDVATFGVSNTTNLSCGDSPDGEFAHTIVGDIIFSEGASAYTITITPVFDVIFPSILNIYGVITNNSGKMQNFVAAASGSTKEASRIYFIGSDASAGENVVITNEGGDFSAGDGIYGGFTQFGFGFDDAPSAGKATFINNGGTVSGAVGGATVLYYYSNAESATFISNPGAVSGAFAGYTYVGIYSPANIGSSTFIANAATVTGAEGGWVEIDGGISDGATFTANGATTAGPQAGQIYVYGGDGNPTFTGNSGTGSGAEGGLIDLFALPASDQAIAIAKGGTNGGLGGTILIEGRAVVDLGQFQVFGNGTLDLSPVTSPKMNIGSLSGTGMVLLSGHTLGIGNNNLSTTFSGVMQESGSLLKVGSGVLTLGGANTYTGVTTVSGGTLRLTNRTGSATGTGPVKVTTGTLGGKGTITGTVTVGTGSGAGAVLAPSVGASQPATFTLQRTLTFKADGTYTYKLNTNNGSADQVSAKGVSIESGAQFGFQAVANKKLTNGSVFTAINNTSANPISGTFANLADGSTLTAGRNKFEVSYSGGDGNDLTLAVPP